MELRRNRARSEAPGCWNSKNQRTELSCEAQTGPEVGRLIGSEFALSLGPNPENRGIPIHQ